MSRGWQVCSQCTALFFWDILEVWIQLPVERWHSSMWRWPMEETVRYFRTSRVLTNEVSPRLPALLLWAIKQLWGAQFCRVSGVQFCPFMFTPPWSDAGAEIKQLWKRFMRCKLLFPHLVGHTGTEYVNLWRCLPSCWVPNPNCSVVLWFYDLNGFWRVNTILLHSTSYLRGWEVWVFSD